MRESTVCKSRNLQRFKRGRRARTEATIVCDFAPVFVDFVVLPAKYGKRVAAKTVLLLPATRLQYWRELRSTCTPNLCRGKFCCLEFLVALPSQILGIIVTVTNANLFGMQTTFIGWVIL